jgi:polar amino acid transport system substrate-binding protein
MNAHNRSLPWRLGACVAAVALLSAVPVAARTLAEVQARGVISMCANPDSLPHASNKPKTPGFQVEIGRALANVLGLQLQVDWIVARMRASLVDCDMLLDTIADPEAQRAPVKLSNAYQRSGVALALRAGSGAVQGFQNIAPNQRVGVMVSSLASKLLDQRGLRTVPYAFESDMVSDLAKGELDACAVSPASIAYYIYTHPDSGLRYVHAYDAEPELRWNLAVGLRRSDDALLDTVNSALDKLIHDGTLARIYAHYGVDYRQPY